jgi:predicted butyrate kinase (DUF1464 family)
MSNVAESIAAAVRNHRKQVSVVVDGVIVDVYGFAGAFHVYFFDGAQSSRVAYSYADDAAAAFVALVGEDDAERALWDAALSP